MIETTGTRMAGLGKQCREHIRCTPTSVVRSRCSQTVGWWAHVDARGRFHPTAAADSLRNDRPLVQRHAAHAHPTICLGLMAGDGAEGGPPQATPGTILSHFDCMSSTTTGFGRFSRCLQYNQTPFIMYGIHHGSVCACPLCHAHCTHGWGHATAARNTQHSMMIAGRLLPRYLVTYFIRSGASISSVTMLMVSVHR